jgi:hypothetical protein
MQNTDEPQEESVLDAVKLDYIDSKELTDTAELVLEEPLADKISHVLENAVEAVKSHTEKD